VTSSWSFILQLEEVLFYESVAFALGAPKLTFLNSTTRPPLISRSEL